VYVRKLFHSGTFCSVTLEGEPSAVVQGATDASTDRGETGSLPH
jgi:hypothetical protein